MKHMADYRTEESISTDGVHTKRRPKNLAPTGILIRATLEAQREDGNKWDGHFLSFRLFGWLDSGCRSVVGLFAYVWCCRVL